MNPRQLISKIYRRTLRELRSILWNVVEALFHNGTFRFVLADESRIDYPIKASVAKMLFLGNFENNEMEFVRKSLKRGDIVFDIGANAGIYTIMASKLVGQTGHVYAFEPSPRELKLLAHNIEINQLKNVTLIERAVSNCSGRVKLAIAEDGALNSLVNTCRPDQKIECWQEVDSISLDEFVREYSIQRVDFIKLDVEGAEKLVLEGANAILKNSHPVTVLFESSDSNTGSFGYTVQDFLSELLEHGQRLYVLGKQGVIDEIAKFSSGYGKRIYNFVLRSGPREANQGTG